MGEWTNLSDVKESVTSGTHVTFRTALVWIVNYVATNPYPRKFVYSACPARLDTGCLCGKSQEFGPKCDHGFIGEPAYQFQLILQDAVHGGVPPIRAQVWDMGATFLGCSTKDFAKCSEAEQTNYVLSTTQDVHKAEVILSVKNHQATLQLISFCNSHTFIALPPSVRVSAHSPCKVGCSKDRIVADVTDVTRKLQHSRIKDAAIGEETPEAASRIGVCTFVTDYPGREALAMPFAYEEIMSQTVAKPYNCNLGSVGPNKWYAVVHGRVPSIYRTWAEAGPLVTGFSGANHKSFKSQYEAEDWLHREHLAIYGTIWRDPRIVTIGKHRQDVKFMGRDQAGHFVYKCPCCEEVFCSNDAFDHISSKGKCIERK